MPYSQTVEAIYENGILRPLKALEGFPERCKVTVTIESADTAPHPLLQCAGMLSDEEAADLQGIIADEFESIDPNAW